MMGARRSSASRSPSPQAASSSVTSWVEGSGSPICAVGSQERGGGRIYHIPGRLGDCGMRISDCGLMRAAGFLIPQAVISIPQSAAARSALPRGAAFEEGAHALARLARLEALELRLGLVLKHPLQTLLLAHVDGALGD